MTSDSEFEEIYRANVDGIYRLCLYAVRSPPVAEDLTSEVFLAFHLRRDSISPDQAGAWLTTVAKRRAADYWRRHYVDQRWRAASVLPAPTTPKMEFPLEVLLRQCPALKPEHTLCLILRFRHDMSRSEIAERTGLSELQVKSLLQYSLTLLRESHESRKRRSNAEPELHEILSRKGTSSAG